MKNIKFINNLKIRGSWGKLGNSDALGLYAYLPVLNSGLIGTSNLVFNNSRTQYIYQGVMASPDLTWETVRQTNIGVDLGVLRNRLTITADYYVKMTTDLLSIPNLPNIIGVQPG